MRNETQAKAWNFQIIKLADWNRSNWIESELHENLAIEVLMMTIDDRWVGGLELLVSWWHDDIGGWWSEHGQNDDDVILIFWVFQNTLYYPYKRNWLSWEDQK